MEQYEIDECLQQTQMAIDSSILRLERNLARRVARLGRSLLAIQDSLFLLDRVAIRLGEKTTQDQG